jgi:cob(I)alamin adenosyltransferase
MKRHALEADTERLQTQVTRMEEALAAGDQDAAAQLDALRAQVRRLPLCVSHLSLGLNEAGAGYRQCEVVHA